MEASFEQLELEEVDKNDESMCWLLDEWETSSYEKKKQVFDRFFEETEKKIERHGYGSRDDILKDCEILKTLLLKIDDFKKRITVDCSKVQLKYNRAMRAKAKIELILWDIFNTYKDYMFEEHKVWMMEKNIHVMTRDDISELICNFGRSVGTYKHALRQCGAEVLKEPKEKVQMKNTSVIQVIERNREEYMLLEKKIGCLLIEMYKASEPYKPGGQVKHTLHGYVREAERILGLLWDELEALGNPGYAQPPDARQQGYCSHIAALPPTPHIAPVQPPTLAGLGNQQLNILASFPPQGSVQTSYGVQPGPSSLAQAGYGYRQGNNAAYHQVPNHSSTRTDSIHPAPMQLGYALLPTLSGYSQQDSAQYHISPGYGSALGYGQAQPYDVPQLATQASHWQAPPYCAPQPAIQPIYWQAPPYCAPQLTTQPIHWQAPPY